MPDLPISNALSEASTDSLTEVLSRDPENYSKQDRAKIIEALREQSARWTAAEASGKKPKAATVPTPAKAISLKDLGL